MISFEHMKNKLLYSLEDDLKSRINNPAFKKAWEDLESEYLLAKKLIKKRKEKKLSQRQLAKKVATSQALISRIETMQANPSFLLLARIAKALESELEIS